MATTRLPGRRRSTRSRVRAFRRDDAKAVARLVRSLNRQQGDPESRDIAGALIRDALGPRRRINVIVATIGDRIIGYALYALSYETSYAAQGLYLNDLYVAPRARRHGVARVLLGAVARAGKSRGASYIWMTSRPWNQDAHRFFASLGARMEPVFVHALIHDAFTSLAERESHAEQPPLKSNRTRKRR